MKYKLLLIGMLSPCLSSAFNMNVCVLANGGTGLGGTFYGTTNCGSGSVASLTVVGNLNLSGTAIEQLKENQGDLNANNAKVSALNVSGNIDGQDSTFGSIIATGTVSLNSSSANSIVINGSSGLEPSAVYLGDHSEVGDITFSQGGGMVYVSNDSQITGKVTGASVENTGDGDSIGGPVANP